MVEEALGWAAGTVSAGGEVETGSVWEEALADSVRW